MLGSLRFSADGASLAFVSDRGDHSFVGVYDVATRSIRWLDPGVDRDGEPAFSPDGNSLAFLRLPAQKERFDFGAEREGEPWSIRVADVASGRGREVFRADKGPGSVFSGVEAPNQVLWGSGDRLVFPWEKSGWRHLYSVPAAGGFVVTIKMKQPSGRAVLAQLKHNLPTLAPRFFLKQLCANKKEICVFGSTE